MRVNGAFGQLVPFVDVVTLEHDYVFADRDQVLLFDSGLRVFDQDAPRLPLWRERRADAVEEPANGLVEGVGRLRWSRDQRAPAKGSTDP